MSETAADPRTGRRAITTASAVVAAIVLALSLWAGWNGDGASTHVVTGWAVPNAAGTAISLHDAPEGGPGEGYVIAGAEWKAAGSGWHDGADIPTCVGTDTGSLTPVRLGLVTVETPDGGTREQATWLECLE